MPPAPHSPEEDNPYAAPGAPLARRPDMIPSDVTCWRRGHLAILSLNAQLPPRCVQCNTPTPLPVQGYPVRARGRIWMALMMLCMPLALFNPVILLTFPLIAFLTQRKATIAPAFCDTHLWHQKKVLAWAIAASLLFLVGVITSANRIEQRNPSWLVPMFLGVPLAGVFVERLFSGKIYAHEITDEAIELKNCGEPFLASLPDEAELPHDALPPEGAR